MSKIASVSIYVSDLDAATEFYTSVLGFRVQEKHPGVVQLDSEGAALVLCEGPKAAKRAYPAGVIVGLPVADLAKRLRELKKRGVELVHEEPQPFPAGRFAALYDPSGNAVELLQFS
jgi:lactoylglutathione lyase